MLCNKYVSFIYTNVRSDTLRLWNFKKSLLFVLYKMLQTSVFQTASINVPKALYSTVDFV